MLRKSEASADPGQSCSGNGTSRRLLREECLLQVASLFRAQPRSLSCPAIAPLRQRDPDRSRGPAGKRPDGEQPELQSCASEPPFIGRLFGVGKSDLDDIVWQRGRPCWWTGDSPGFCQGRCEFWVQAITAGSGRFMKGNQSGGERGL